MCTLQCIKYEKSLPNNLPTRGKTQKKCNVSNAYDWKHSNTEDDAFRETDKIEALIGINESQYMNRYELDFLPIPMKTQP